MSLRRLAEILGSGITVKRRLPRGFRRAPFYASGAAGLRYLVRSTATMDVDLLRNAHEIVKRGDTVWDVGANVGVFSVAAAVMAGRTGEIFAIEPDTTLVELLRRTAASQSRSLA